MANTIFSANRSAVLIDGEAVDGLQSLAFRVLTEREDIRAIGSAAVSTYVFSATRVREE